MYTVKLGVVRMYTVTGCGKVYTVTGCYLVYTVTGCGKGVFEYTLAWAG